MEEYQEVKDLLNKVSERIAVHSDIVRVYDEHAALDFNIFNFFKVGENKVSEILAFFLNPEASHGQKDKFLKAFLQKAEIAGIDTSTVKVEVERRIDHGRRIDIYITAGNKCIAIENKLWAVDQSLQLQDYSNYLEKNFNGNYCLIYLTPYGALPSVHSITEGDMDRLKNDDKFKILSYEEGILKMLNEWLLVCNADNVSYFLNQFKKLLIAEIMTKNNFNTNVNLENLVRTHQSETKALVVAYQEIEQQVIKKFNDACLKISNIINDSVFPPTKPFRDHNIMVFKLSCGVNNNTIYIQLIKDGIDLKIHFYYDDDASVEVINFCDDFLQELPIDPKSTTNDIAILYKSELLKLKEFMVGFDAQSK